MTVIEPIAPPGTLGSPSADYLGGSTSSLLLPKIGPALLPPFIAIAILTGGTSQPAHLELPRPPQRIIALRATGPVASERLINEKTEESLPDLAQSVRSLRQRSGLTWDERFCGPCTKPCSGYRALPRSGCGGTKADTFTAAGPNRERIDALHATRPTASTGIHDGRTNLPTRTATECTA